MFARLALGFFCFSTLAQAVIDLKKVEADLKGPGLVGWVHGAVPEYREYVFTIRGTDFFEHLEISLIAANPNIAKTLATLQRHDQLRLSGVMLANTSGQVHVRVTAVTLLKRQPPAQAVPPYAHQTKLPQDLGQQGTVQVVVHAVGASGDILVVEYKDAVVPIFVQDKAQTQGLYRGDKIEIDYVLQAQPGAPTHLNLDKRSADPLRVLERIAVIDGQPLTLEGHLVLFPISPQITRQVYALRVTDARGLSLNYTLVNFDDDEGVAFGEIQAKADGFWKADAAAPTNGRNCFFKTGVKVKAIGTGTVISPNQANPQIWLTSANDLTLVP